jgi:hypothetical protein
VEDEEEEEEEEMEFVRAAIGKFLPKLAILLKDEYDLQKSVKQGIEFPQRERESTQTFLEMVSNVPRELLDEQDKIWARDVRQLCYNIEDKIDTFMLHVDSLDPSEKDNFIQKCYNFLSDVRAWHIIANDIKDFKSKVSEVADRCNRFKIPRCCN